MKRLPWAQQELLEQLEAGGRIVQDEKGNPWLEDGHGGRRRVRKPTVEALRKKGYLDRDQLSLGLPKIYVSRSANQEYWLEWLRANFGQSFSELKTEQKLQHYRLCANQIVSAIEAQVQAAKGLLLQK